MQKWEYKTLLLDSNTVGWDFWKNQNPKILQELGNEGWELVGTLSSGDCLLIFKRPKQ